MLPRDELGALPIIWFACSAGGNVLGSGGSGSERIRRSGVLAIVRRDAFVLGRPAYGACTSRLRAVRWFCERVAGWRQHVVHVASRSL